MEIANQTIEFSVRLLGIGLGSYFLGGVISGVAIILTAFIVINNPKRKKTYTVIYFFLCITGILIARIVILAYALSFFMFLVYWFKRGGGILVLKKLGTLIFASIIVIIFLNLFFSSLFETSAIKHAFELFINLYESKSLSTKSTTNVYEMLIFPDNLKTFLIGDGRFYNSDSSYYMRTDVGFSRLIFYYGFLGSILFFMPHIYISKMFIDKKYDNIIKILIVVLFVYLMISNFKGLLDLNWLIFIYFWMHYLQNFKNEDTLYH